MSAAEIIQRDASATSEWGEEGQAAYDAILAETPSAADVLDPRRIVERAKAAAQQVEHGAQAKAARAHEVGLSLSQAEAPLETAYAEVREALAALDQAVTKVREQRSGYEKLWRELRKLKPDALPGRVDDWGVRVRADRGLALLQQSIFDRISRGVDWMGA